MKDREYYQMLQGRLDVFRCDCGGQCENCRDFLDNPDMDEFNKEAASRNHAGLPDREISEILREVGLPGIKHLNDLNDDSGDFVQDVEISTDWDEEAWECENEE